MKHIAEVHEQSRGTYGWPRVHAELRLGLGLEVNHKRVRRLMREAGLQACTGAVGMAARSATQPTTRPLTGSVASSPWTGRTGCG